MPFPRRARARYRNMFWSRTLRRNRWSIESPNPPAHTRRIDQANLKERTSMQIDIVLPQVEMSGDPDEVVDFAQLIEELDFGRVVIYDHVVGAERSNRPAALTGPYDEHSLFHEPLVLMGFLAALTKNVELMTGVLVLPQRQTALVAKQAAEVQILSRGRMVLGVGVGWNYVEYESLGMGYAKRGAMIEDQVAVLRRLWSEPVISVDTPHHHIDRAGIVPRPQPMPPIWFGGSSRRAYERAARLGDGFIHPARGEAVETAVADIIACLHAEGREQSDFGTEFFLDVQGGRDDWARDLDRFAKLGISRVAFRTIGQGLRTFGDHMRLIEEFGNFATSHHAATNGAMPGNGRSADQLDGVSR
ncbi:LLM class F420-dependent oxidoreductase [Rhodococcus sp. NPDC059968]|uniref:LLM class F420-dependent oxidoreductase n=1 Tax=Rhodococcus sp. NPDC059968 TaxID=3347017 RepID=UPI00366E7B8E